jgi:hypothetical protein
MPPKVKISQEECSAIKDNLTKISDSYDPMINDVGLLMDTLRKVMAKAENLDDFVVLFGTKQMKTETTRLLRKIGGFYSSLDKMYGDLKYTQEKSNNTHKLFGNYEKFCQKTK